MSKKKGIKWRVIETREVEGAAVQVCELPLRIPRYSFKVGTASLEGGSMRVGNRLTVFNAEAAALLLAELGEKYRLKRESVISEIEDAKKKWRDENTVE